MSMQRRNSYLVKQNKNHIIKLCYHAYYRMKEGFDVINHTLWCMATKQRKVYRFYKIVFYEIFLTMELCSDLQDIQIGENSPFLRTR